MGKQREDLTGRKFYKLKVKDRADDYISPQGLHFPQWVCECECGNVIVARGDSLKNGHTKSCGCMRIESITNRIIHGKRRKGSYDRLYRVWANMLQRCTNEKRPDYRFYGGRGITVCDEWHDYVSFQTWAISNGYEKHLSIDRKNTNDGYNPNNCRWVSMKVQQNNKRNNHLLIHNGETLNISGWADVTGIPYSTIRSRINLLGWTTEEALTTPVRKTNRKQSEISI